MVTTVHRRDRALAAQVLTRQLLLSTTLLAPVIPALAQEGARPPADIASLDIEDSRMDAGKRAGLRVSSRMLALAVAIYESSAGPP